MNSESNLYDKIIEAGPQLLDYFFSVDFEFDLTEALMDTQDELRVGEGYMTTDRKKFWTKTAERHISQLN